MFDLIDFCIKTSFAILIGLIIGWIILYPLGLARIIDEACKADQKIEKEIRETMDDIESPSRSKEDR